jgi:hypothetical protein
MGAVCASNSRRSNHARFSRRVGLVLYLPFAAATSALQAPQHEHRRHALTATKPIAELCRPHALRRRGPMLGVVGGSSSLCAAMKAKRRGEMPEVLQKFLFELPRRHRRPRTGNHLASHHQNVHDDAVNHSPGPLAAPHATRSIASRMMRSASPGPPQRATETHLPGSKSL